MFVNCAPRFAADLCAVLSVCCKKYVLKSVYLLINTGEWKHEKIETAVKPGSAV